MKLKTQRSKLKTSANNNYHGIPNACCCIYLISKSSNLEPTPKSPINWILSGVEGCKYLLFMDTSTSLSVRFSVKLPFRSRINLQIFKSSHLHIFKSPHLHISTSSHLQIFKSPPAIVT